MKETEMVILFGSDEAAHIQTGISGWVSRRGRFFGDDERAARYDGCTHILCEDCGSPCPKGRLVCGKCSDVRDEKRYQSMPKEEWDGEGMLYSDAADKYFSDWEDVEDYCEDEDIEVSKLRLVICEPNYLPFINDDFGCDELAEDGELPDTIIQAIEDFNKVIKETGAVSWYPGKRATITNQTVI